MMNDERLVKISKALSMHLRHRPEKIGLTLAPGGWVEVADLLEALNARGIRLDRAGLEEVVARNDKKRFAFDETGLRIRAQQGHSVEVDLGLEEAGPPGVLYHGTGEATVPAILRDGLRKMRRHHVHLSPDPETARRVGARHGRPAVLVVDAPAMQAQGWTFYRSGNGVWLVDAVPPPFLSRIETDRA